MSPVALPTELISFRIRDARIAPWKNKGIKTLDSLFDGSRLRSLPDLQSRYNLPPTDFFVFSQIKHLLSTLSSHQGAIPTKILSFLQSPLARLAKWTRVFYDLLTGNDQFTKTPNLIKWEVDLGKQFTVLQWIRAISYAHRSSACANHREQYQKRITRWYFTPLRIARAYTAVSPYCWRSCGSVGTLLHIFWSCPLLRRFWDDIFIMISSLMNQPCPATPEFALLLLGIDAIPPKYRTLVCNILHAARLSIARHWKSLESPTLLEVNTIVSNIYLCERTLAWYIGSVPSFHRAWSPWQTLFPNLN